MKPKIKQDPLPSLVKGDREVGIYNSTGSKYHGEIVWEGPRGGYFF